MSVTAIELEMIPSMFESVAAKFNEKKDELCEMDANMGDGDLGLTMQKGYSLLPDLIRENTAEGDIGKTLMKAGMKMAGAVPSTMGTLMSSGVMQGGKAVGAKGKIEAKDMADFYEGFAEGIKKRGKCEEGDRTIYDSLVCASRKAREAFEGGGDIAAIAKAALEGAEEGVEATKDMIPKYGKAAVFSAKAKGIADQGAVAGKYLIEGIYDYISKL